jgi:hypothetical protein
MSDSYREIALTAIDALIADESMTESEFGVGGVNYHERSEALRKRIEALDRDAAQQPES